MDHEIGNNSSTKPFSIKTDVLEHLLANKLDSPYAKEISKVITAHLIRSEMGVPHLLEAIFSGAVPKLKYKIGDFCYMPLTELPTWKFDSKLTIAKGITNKGFIKAQIIAADIYNKHPYHMKTTAYLPDESTVEVESWVFEDSLFSEEEFFI